VAGRGPAPKERRSRGREAHVETLPDVVPGPVRPLPDDLLPDGESWHPATLRWWQTWNRAPQGQMLSETDWRELELAATLHHEFMKRRTFSLGAELRLRISKFGATPEDRQRLRVRLGPPGVRPVQSSSGAADPKVVEIRERRRRLTEGSAS
jgi:hypothetical protein